MRDNSLETAESLWRFVHNFNGGLYDNRSLSMDQACTIDQIVEAAEEIVNIKQEIMDLINK